MAREGSAVPLASGRARAEAHGLQRQASTDPGWARMGAVELGMDCLLCFLLGLPVTERIDFEKA